MILRAVALCSARQLSIDLVERRPISRACSAPICVSTQVHSIYTTHMSRADALLCIGGEGRCVGQR